ncbi:MAG: GNAT family N-acetyltransferase [Flavobacteriales bacterium]|nr:GNAT family N-acetyltransferase [Flavobacteriales bacterium]
MSSNSSGGPAIRISLHDSIHLIHREDWELVAKEAGPYLQYDYLCALEDAMAGSMEFRYAIHYCEQNLPMGIVYFQLVDLVDHGSSYREALGRLGKALGSRTLKEMRLRTLVNGNVFHCGDHGSFFRHGVDAAYRFKAVEDTLWKLGTADYFHPKVSALLLKDMPAPRTEGAESLTDRGYHAMAMDVNMVLDVDPEWQDLSGYAQALNSKSRTRLNALMARSSALLIRELPAHEILESTDDLQRLFNNVLDRSPFSFGRLNMQVYAAWKEQLGDRLLFRGFYLNDELVGFSSACVVGDTLDVQYVGIDYARNEEHAIYQRMLVDLLDFALRNNVQRINYGRTAEQAKSNLGALPHGTRIYVKHRNAIANKLIGPFLRSVEPGAFELRSPFKKVLA